METTRTEPLQRPTTGVPRVQPSYVGQVLTWAIVLALVFVLPQVLSKIWINNLSQVLIAVVGVIGLNILLGYTGQISIGHGAFAGIGGFTAAVLNNRFGVPILIGVPLGGLLAAAVGVVVGIPSLRVRGLYLAVATLASQEILSWYFEHMKKLTHARTSSVDVGKVWIGNHWLNARGKHPEEFFYLFALVAIVAYVVSANLIRTRLGRAFVAIRDREIAAEIIGVNAFSYKLLAFAISAFYAGIAGGMQAILFSRAQITPSLFDINLSINWLAMAIIGGLGSLPGPLLGTAFLVLIPIELRDWIGHLKGTFHVLSERYTQVQDILFGGIIIAFLIFEPNGLYAIWVRIRRTVKKLTFQRADLKS
ncbi:MAG: branched-chain amino acid ABC transporter permease [Dehalococcoidia bacterium]